MFEVTKYDQQIDSFPDKKKLNIYFSKNRTYFEKFSEQTIRK